MKSTERKKVRSTEDSIEDLRDALAELVNKLENNEKRLSEMITNQQQLASVVNSLTAPPAQSKSRKIEPLINSNFSTYLFHTQLVMIQSQ